MTSRVHRPCETRLAALRHPEQHQLLSLQIRRLSDLELAKIIVDPRRVVRHPHARRWDRQRVLVQPQAVLVVLAIGVRCRQTLHLVEVTRKSLESIRRQIKRFQFGEFDDARRQRAQLVAVDDERPQPPQLADLVREARQFIVTHHQLVELV